MQTLPHGRTDGDLDMLAPAHDADAQRHKEAYDEPADALLARYRDEWKATVDVNRLWEKRMWLAEETLLWPWRVRDCFR